MLEDRKLDEAMAGVDALQLRPMNPRWFGTVIGNAADINDRSPLRYHRSARAVAASGSKRCPPS